jgi:hypothetical protein
MKRTTLPHSFTLLAVTAFAAIGLLASAGAQPLETSKTIKGEFNSTDGNHGTYVETTATEGNVETITIVYTRQSDKETSTDITVKTPDTATKSYTVSYSHTDYGSTAKFTSDKTVDKVKGGYVGSGTYTNADGVSGKFRTLETTVDGINVISAAYIPATGTGTNELRVEQDALGFIAVRTLTVTPTGATTSVITTRYPKH